MKKNLCFCKAPFAFFATFFLLLPLFISCEVGVGEALDLEAPHIEIITPKNNGYAAKSFDLIGYASDNHAISDIEVQYTYRETKDGEKITATKHTGMGGRRSGEWSCHLEFAFDQEISITVYAHDAMGNQSIESSDSIVVVIDSELPENGAILITRNSGFTTNTAKISKFLGEDGATAQRNIDSGNKDNFQNESITLSCNIKETYEISDVYLNLYEISSYKSETSYTKTLIKEKIKKNASSTNPFNPEFELTQAMLTGYNSSLKNGVHYIMPEIVAVDGAGNKSVPNSSAEPMVFAWEAEYDKPKATLPLYYKDNLVKFPEATKLPVILFDDDGLKSCTWTLQSKSNASKKKTGTEDISAKNLRDYNFEIDTEKFDDNTKIPDGDYSLTINVIDQITGTGGGRTEATKTYTYNVKITNADAPTINIEEPAYNSTPALTDKSKFTLKGASYDNGQVNDIAIAWCRDGNSKTATTYFETFDFSKNKGSKTESSDKKLVVWNLDGITHTSSGAQYTDSFSKEFNIYNDFKNASGTLVNEPKTFVIAAKDATGNISTEVWRVGAFNSLPKFEITTSQASDFTGATTKTETQSMVSKIPEKTLYVKIKPDSALEITEFKVDNKNCTSADIASGKVITITTPASDSKTVITYSAKDKLGNGGDANTFTIQFDKVPEITNIFCTEEGETLNKGKLNFQVAFDKSVTVDKTGTGTAKLKIECYKGSTKKDTLDATYISGSDTSTLYFEMEIPSGVEYDNVKVIKSGDNWIGLTNASIKRGEINANLGGSLTPNFNVTIDTKKPELTGYAGMRAGKNYSRKGGNGNDKNDVIIKMNFSEPVTAQNGYIAIYRKGSQDVTDANPHTWHIPAVISADVFEKIWNESSTTNREMLSGSSTSTSINGKDAYGVKSLVAAGPYKMYTNGLKLNDKPIYQYVAKDGNAVKSTTKIHDTNSVMVPDLTTKYVLDWQFDTAETSDTKKTIYLANGESKLVSERDIRTALEAVGYHKTTIPLSRLTFNTARTQATLTIKDSDFIDGIHEGVEFIMEFPEKAFADDVQNTSGEIEKYTFTVGKTATPVIRVNRWSTNATDDQVKNSKNGSIAPTGEAQGKARVKIDCETPNATIQYQVTTLTIDSDFVESTAKTNFQKNLTPPDYKPANVGATASTNNSITPSFNNVGMLGNGEHGADKGGIPSFDKANYKRQIEAKQTYSGIFSVGDGSVTTGQRIYIAAQATSNSDLQTSENAFEGAFKTMMQYKYMLRDGNGKQGYNRFNFKVHACQSPEGVSSTAGWPISMRLHTHDTDTIDGTRDCYKVAARDKDGWVYRWMSWELISDDFFTVTTVSWNFQKAIDSLASYGSFIWGYRVDTWGMDQGN